MTGRHLRRLLTTAAVIAYVIVAASITPELTPDGAAAP
jgi:hypothetical protein